MNLFMFRKIQILLLLFPLFYNCFAQEKKEKPNIIFIFADDLGWGDLSCYGNWQIKTPSIDKLASRGTLFTQFYVAGSVCSPSRAGIMSGQYPARNEIFGHISSKANNEERKMPDALNPNLYMLTDMLKEAGYITAHFGKWHLGNVSPADYGIDVFRVDRASKAEEDDRIDIWSPDARPTATKDIFDETIEFIKNQKEKPFYINAWLSDVHATLNPSKEQMQRVIDETGWQWPIKGVSYSSPEQVYFAALLEMDRQVGIFLNKIENMGLSENTIIIFSSDNGPEEIMINNARHSGLGSTGPLRGRKRSIYEGGVRVPFIVSWPGHIPENKVNNKSVVNGVDFLPSIAAIVGKDISDLVSLDGEDMSDVWLGADRKRTRSLYWEWRYRVYGHPWNMSPMIAIRDGDYKLLTNPDKSRIELFNVVQDPGEMMNLVEQEPVIVENLMEKAMSWYGELPENPVFKGAGKNDWDWPVSH